MKILDFERLSQLQKEAGTIAVATVVRVLGSTPRETGARMVVLPSGRIEGTIGGGILEKMVIEDAMALLGSKSGFEYKQYRLKPEDEEGVGAECGGDADVFIEVVGKPQRLLIMGGGHIGLALYKMARVMDLQVTVVDDRPEFASRERFPDAEVVMAEYSDPGLRKHLDPETSVVILTHGHLHDADALKNVLLGDKVMYVGMIGSRRKVAAVLKQLADDGVDPSALETVFAPVGLDIGAETPAEIAVAVLAEIINVKKKGTPSPQGMGRRK